MVVMRSLRWLLLVGLALLLLLPFGLAWASQHAVVRLRPAHEAIEVETDRSHYRSGDTLRIAIRNVGENTLEGSPSLWVLTESGGLMQSFGVAGFELRLDPGAAVWVDWPTGPSAKPCLYGTVDGEGRAGAASSFPCPMGRSDEATPIDDAAGAPVRCGSCRPFHGLAGTFVLVGMFGAEADAAVVEIR